MKKIYIISLALFLLSCKGMQIRQDVTSKFIEYSENPWIEIKENLIVRPENARVYLQNGKQIYPASLDMLTTNCEIEINTVLEEKQIVFPGRFKNTSIGIEASPIVFMENTKINVAFGGGGSGAPVDVKRYWKFKLYSKTRPEVLNFICRGPLDQPSVAMLPTLDGIKQAVGNIIEVHLIDE
jgi:hypothetical protein